MLGVRAAPLLPQQSNCHPSWLHYFGREYDDPREIINAFDAAVYCYAQKKIAWSSGRYDNGEVINDEGSGYGFGCNIDATNDMIWHTGSWMGTSTYIMRYLKTGVTIIVLSNDENAEANDIANEIDTALGDVGSGDKGA